MAFGLEDIKAIELTYVNKNYYEIFENYRKFREEIYGLFKIDNISESILSLNNNDSLEFHVLIYSKHMYEFSKICDVMDKYKTSDGILVDDGVLISFYVENEEGEGAVYTDDVRLKLENVWKV